MLVQVVTSFSGLAQTKKRIAVNNFDFATVQSSVAAIFGSNQDVGKGIADMLVDRLVNDKTVFGDRAQGARPDHA